MSKVERVNFGKDWWKGQRSASDADELLIVPERAAPTDDLPPLPRSNMRRKPLKDRLGVRNDRRPVSCPPELDSVVDCLREFRPLLISPCVYFLVKKNMVIYVGQTINLQARMESHYCEKDFDAVFYIEVPLEQRCAIEAAFIQALRPPLNLEVKPGDYRHALKPLGFK